MDGVSRAGLNKIVGTYFAEGMRKPTRNGNPGELISLSAHRLARHFLRARWRNPDDAGDMRAMAPFFKGMSPQQVEQCISVLREFMVWRPGPAGRCRDRDLPSQDEKTPSLSCPAQDDAPQRCVKRQRPEASARMDAISVSDVHDSFSRQCTARVPASQYNWQPAPRQTGIFSAPVGIAAYLTPHVYCLDYMQSDFGPQSAYSYSQLQNIPAAKLAAYTGGGRGYNHKMPPSSSEPRMRGHDISCWRGRRSEDPCSMPATPEQLVYGGVQAPCPDSNNQGCKVEGLAMPLRGPGDVARSQSLLHLQPPSHQQQIEKKTGAERDSQFAALATGAGRAGQVYRGVGPDGESMGSASEPAASVSAAVESDRIPPKPAGARQAAPLFGQGVPAQSGPPPEYQRLAEDLQNRSIYMSEHGASTAQGSSHQGQAGAKLLPHGPSPTDVCDGCDMLDDTYCAPWSMQAEACKGEFVKEECKGGWLLSSPLQSGQTWSDSRPGASLPWELDYLP